MAASGDAGAAEPLLQYTTTVLRVSIHCEGCRKKVKKVLHGIEGVYKVTIDAVQHKVTVTGGVGADALVRRLLKSGKQASLWPVPPAAAEDKKPEGVVAVPSHGKSGKGADKAAMEAESAKKPEKEKGGPAKKPGKEKGSGKKPEKAGAPEKKGSPEPAKEATAEEAGGEETGGNKGKKKNHKQKEAGEGADAAVNKQPPQNHAMPVPALGPPDRPHAGFPYYALPPVASYNVAHPSSSVSYYAPTPVASMPPPQTPYGYPPYPPTMWPPEFLYVPPPPPPQESYNSMFNEETASSCSLM